MYRCTSRSCDWLTIPDCQHPCTLESVGLHPHTQVELGTSHHTGAEGWIWGKGRKRTSGMQARNATQMMKSLKNRNGNPDSLRGAISETRAVTTQPLGKALTSPMDDDQHLSFFQGE